MLLWVLGVYLVVRAVAEPFVIDMSDPATYRNDWGGPHLAGVLAVHCGPGIAAAALMGRGVLRRVALRRVALRRAALRRVALRRVAPRRVALRRVRSSAVPWLARP